MPLINSVSKYNILYNNNVDVVMLMMINREMITVTTRVSVTHPCIHSCLVKIHSFLLYSFNVLDILI